MRQALLQRRSRRHDLARQSDLCDRFLLEADADEVARLICGAAKIGQTDRGVHLWDEVDKVNAGKCAAGALGKVLLIARKHVDLIRIGQRIRLEERANPVGVSLPSTQVAEDTHQACARDGSGKASSADRQSCLRSDTLRRNTGRGAEGRGAGAALGGSCGSGGGREAANRGT